MPTCEYECEKCGEHPVADGILSSPSVFNRMPDVCQDRYGFHRRPQARIQTRLLLRRQEQED